MSVRVQAGSKLRETEAVDMHEVAGLGWAFGEPRCVGGFSQGPPNALGTWMRSSDAEVEVQCRLQSSTAG